MPCVLITGANRGLGLELTRQYASDGWKVIAGCRNPLKATELKALAGDRVSVHAVDVQDAQSIQALADSLKGQAIDVLLCNAGVYMDRKSKFGSIDYENWATTMEINVFGPMRMVEAFVDNIEQSELKTVAMMSSQMGSIAENSSGGSYMYRSSKSALNMASKSLSWDLAERGISVILLHPGWVHTDMGGSSAALEPPESVAGMRTVIAGANMEKSGHFFDYAGRELAW